MILIGNAIGVSVGGLPCSDVINYVIENDISKLTIKLKTVAKSTSCLKVFLHSELKTIELQSDVKDKTVYFDNTDNLVDLLYKQDKEEKVGEKVEVQEEQVFAPVRVSEEEVEKDDIVDVDNTIPDLFMTLPVLDEDTDSLKLQLGTKQKIIDTKDGIIKQLKYEQDNFFKMQEVELLTMKDSYEKTIREANEIIKSLKENASKVQLSPEEDSVLRFLPYIKNPKAAVRREFSDDEKRVIGKIKAPIYVFSCSVGDSLFYMMREVKTIIDGKNNVVLVDFTGDTFIAQKYKIQTKDFSHLLNDAKQDTSKLVSLVDGVRVFPSTPFNDVSFLLFDWVKILLRLQSFAGSRPIIFLFNSMSSFSVKYALSRLASVGKLFIFAKSSPLILNSLYHDIKFIPDTGASIVCLDYIQELKTILEEIGKKNQVYAFPKGVEWHKLGITF